MKANIIPSSVRALAVAIALPVLAFADDPFVLDLDFDSLPSAQGWSLFANYPETQVVGLADGILSFDTRTSHDYVVAGGYRIILDGIDLQPAHVIEFRAAVIDPNPGSSKSHGYYFLDVVGAGSTEMLFRVQNNVARISTRYPQAPNIESTYEFDATEFHDYRIEVDNGIGIKVFIDGFLAAANSTTSISFSGLLYVNFGIQRTASYSEHLRIEISKFRFEKLPTLDPRPVVTVQAPAPFPEGEAPTAPMSLADLHGEGLRWTGFLDGGVFGSESIPASGRPLTLHRRELALPGLAAGPHTLRVEVENDSGQRSVAETTIEVLDVTPPEILSAAPCPAILWPPNGKMSCVKLDALVTDNSGEAAWGVVDIECTEPGAENDMQILDDHSVNLRAARIGRGEGRIYTIWLQAIDAAENISEPFPVEVTVPHDQRGNSNPVRL